MPRRPGDAGRREFLKQSMLAAAALPGVAAPISGEQAPASGQATHPPGEARPPARHRPRASPIRACSRARTSRRLRFPSGASAPAASASADAASCAIGRSSIAPTRATRRITRSPRSGSKPAAASRVRARPRVAPPAAVSRDRCGLGSKQRAGPSAPAGADVHRRVPAGAHRFRGSAAACAGLARRVQPVHPARADDSGLRSPSCAIA